MRALTPSGAAALSSPVICLAILVEMDLTEPVLLNSSGIDLGINGQTYRGTGGLGSIDAVAETPGDFPRINFTMAGVQPTFIAEALLEPVQGKAVRIKVALFDASSGALLDVRLRYSGYLDVMSISDAADAAVISVSSESALLDLLRPRGLYFNDADQQALHPGDLAFQYVNSQVDQKIVWPAAAYFEK